MTDRQAEIIDLIHKEVKPALGCTEPIAVALAVAKAVDIIAENCSCCGDCPLWRQTADFRISVEVSGNILKNGMGVGIPGTGMVGLPVAAALGAVCGDSSKGLEVLQGVSESAVSRARELLDRKRVSIRVADIDRLIANRKSWASKAKREKIEHIAMLFQAALAAKSRVLLKLNAPAKRLDSIVKKLPALHAPTVNKLNDPEWFAVETVVDEHLVRDLIPELMDAGATGIIELPLNKVVF